MKMNPLQITTITPYIGLDGIKFGMSPAEVAQTCGLPDSTSINFFDEPIEYRDGFVFTYSKDAGALVELGVPRECVNVSVGGVMLFQAPRLDRLAELKSIDADAHEDPDVIVFRGLGISITGFRDKDDDDVAMTVFAKGRWDELISDMGPIA